MFRNVSPALCSLLAALALTLSACGGSSTDSTNSADVPSTSSCSTAGVAASSASSYPTVCMLTNKGEIVLELYSDKSPITAANFLKYVNAGFYSNTIFDQVISGFVIQGGGVDTDRNDKTALYPAIALESNNGLSNVRGTIAMAQLSGSTASAQSRFFINTVDNPSLDYSAAKSGDNGYAVFGKVISGLATVDAIQQVAVDKNYQPYSNVVVYWAKTLK